MVRVKICGVTSVDEALRAVEAGADALGVNFHPASPRAVSLETAVAIRDALPPFVDLVGVFVDRPLAEVRSISHEVGLDYAQLHGREGPEFVDAIGVRIIRAARVRSEADLTGLNGWERAAALLLDGAGRRGEFGGATFDWSLVEAARQHVSRPLIIAGGLTPQNVGECVLSTRPAGVDVASGVEDAPGRKSLAKMRAFVRAVREAVDAVRGDR